MNKKILLWAFVMMLLVFPLVKADVVVDLDLTSATYPFRENSGTQYLATNFTNNTDDFTLQNVSIYMYTQGSPDNNVWVSIEGCDGSYKPNGTELATSDTRLSSSIAASGTWENFVFTGGDQIEITQSECYNVIIKSDSTLSAANHFRVGAPNGGGVGNYFWVYGGSWGADARHYVSSKIYGDVAGAPPVGTNLTFTATDRYNGSSINQLTVYIDGVGEFYTSSGTINTNISDSSLLDLDFYLSSNESGGYFNITYLSYNITEEGNASLSPQMWQSELTLEAYEKVTGNQIYGLFNTSISSNTSFFYITAGLHNITFSNSSYINKTEEFNITNLYNGTQNISGVYNSVVNITLYNAFTGRLVNNSEFNYSGTVSNDTYNFNESYVNTTLASSSIAYVNLIQNLSYTFFITHPDYSISDDNYKNVTIENTSQNVNFTLYTTNSLFINVYDETTSQLITSETLTIVLSGALGDDTYNTTNGTLFLSNLTDGNYSVKISGGNYSLRTYSIIVAEKSTQTLNAYLSPYTVAVTFTFLDYDTSETLEGVSISMSRLVNGSWTLVESKTSDITGRSQFTYTPNIRYRFTVTYSGYINKIFDLDPVIFSSYNVRLNKITTYDAEQDYASIGLNYYPTIFYNNELQNFTFTIQSPSGTLINYGINLSYPGGSTGAEGVNSIGETFVVTLNISGAEFLDKVNLTYYYDTSIGDLKTFNIAYSIVGTDVNESSFIKLKDETFGLGDLERVLITVLVILIVAGIITLITAQPYIGGAVGLLILGFLSYIGFTPLWAALISFFVGLFIIFKSSGGGS